MEAMPEIIKRNFIYRRAYNNVYRKNKNFTVVVTGNTGSGKSTLAQKMASDLDPDFNVDRIVFSAEDFLTMLASKEMKPGSCVIFDEVMSDQGASSRNSMSKTNKILSYVSATFRAKRLIVFLILPGLFQLDKNLKAISVAGLVEMRKIDYENKKSVADFSWASTNVRNGDLYWKKPRLLKPGAKRWTTVDHIKVGLPPKDLMKEYEKKKMKFIDDSLLRWNGQIKAETKVNKNLSVKQIADKVKRSRDKFVLAGKVDHTLIMRDFNVGSGKARDIKKLVDLGQ